MQLQCRCVAGVVLLAAACCQILAAACPHYFQLQFGHCLHIESSDKKNWCSAQQFCNSIGGRLLANVSTLLDIRAAFYGSTTSYYLGFTDLTDERGTSEAGWLSTEGELLPEVTGLWRPDGKWRGYSDDDDCLVLWIYGSSFYVSDGLCATLRGFICEPQLHSFARSPRSEFRRTPFPAVADKSPVHCAEDKTNPGIMNQLHCSIACHRDTRCKAFLFNTRTAACRFLLHSDAILEAEVQNDKDWEKFVR